MTQRLETLPKTRSETTMSPPASARLGASMSAAATGTAPKSVRVLMMTMKLESSR